MRRFRHRRARRTADVARLLARLDEMAAERRPRPVRRVARTGFGRAA